MFMSKIYEIFSFVRRNIFTKLRTVNLFYCILISLIFILGILLRFKSYLFSRSLWMDECFLFDNIYNKSFWGFFSQLSFGQSAPPLFLMLEKLVTKLFGIKELALRFVPFIASIIAIPVFYYFSKTFLNKSLSILFANLLFAINIQNIFYAQELKQYSTDLLCFMLLFIFFKDLSVKIINIKSTLYYIIVSTILPLFSLTSYFVIFGWILCQIIECKKYLKKLFIIQIPILLMLCFYYFSILQLQRKEVYIYSPSNLWSANFFSANLINNIVIIKNAINYYFCTNNNLPIFTDFILITLVFLGMCFILKDYQKRVNSLAIFTILIIFITSFLKIYPIFQRSILFIMPLCIIFSAKILDFVSIKHKILSLVIILFTLFAFHNYNLSYFKQCINCNIWYCRFHDEKYPNPKEIMQTLIKNYKSGDIVIINNASISEYNYYLTYYHFFIQKTIFLNYMKDTQQYLDKLKDNEKYWFFYSDDYTKDDIVINNLRQWKNKHKIIFEQSFPYSRSYLLYMQK